MSEMASGTHESEDWAATMDSEGTTNRVSRQRREIRGIIAGSQ